MRCKITNFVAYDLSGPLKRELKPVVECKNGLYVPSKEGIEKLIELFDLPLERVVLSKEIELSQEFIEKYFLPLKEIKVDAKLEGDLLYLRVGSREIPVAIDDGTAEIIRTIFEGRIKAKVYKLKADGEEKILIPISLKV